MHALLRLCFAGVVCNAIRYGLRIIVLEPREKEIMLQRLIVSISLYDMYFVDDLALRLVHFSILFRLTGRLCYFC